MKYLGNYILEGTVIKGDSDGYLDIVDYLGLDLLLADEMCLHIIGKTTMGFKLFLLFGLHTKVIIHGDVYYSPVNKKSYIRVFDIKHSLENISLYTGTATTHCEIA